MKLHQQLENLFKRRINGNDEIIAYMKKLSEEGRFDEPKKVAVFAIILDRLGKMEEEAEIEKSLNSLAGKDIWDEKNATKPLEENHLEWNGIEKTPDPEVAKPVGHEALAPNVPFPKSVQAFPCTEPSCDKTFSSKIALIGHKRSHKPKSS